jgi:hypothetical protein
MSTGRTKRKPDLLDHPGPVSRKRDASTGDVLVTFSTGLSYTIRPDGERYNVCQQAESWPACAKANA